MPSIVPRSSSHSATSTPYSVQETSTSSTSNTPTPTTTRLRTGSVLVTSDSQSQFAVSLAKKYERESGSSSASTASTSTARPRRSTQHAPSRPAPYTTATIVSAALAAFGLGGLAKEGLWPISNPSSGDSDKATTMGMAEQTFAKATTISFSTTSDEYETGSGWLDQAAETTPPPPKPDEDGEATVEDEAEPTQEPEHEAEPVTEANKQQDQEVKDEAEFEPKVRVGSIERIRRSADEIHDWEIFRKPTVLYIKNKAALSSWGRLVCKHVPASVEDKLKFKYQPDVKTEPVDFWTSAINAGSWGVIHIPAGARECRLVMQAGSYKFLHDLQPGKDGNLKLLDLQTGYDLLEYHFWGSVFGAYGEFQDPRLHPENYAWAKEMFRVDPKGCIVMTVDSSCRNGFPRPNQYLIKNVCFNPAVALMKSQGRVGYDNCGLDQTECLKSEGVKHDIYMAYGSSRGTAYGCKNLSEQDVDKPYRFNGWRFKF